MHAAPCLTPARADARRALLACLAAPAWFGLAGCGTPPVPPPLPQGVASAFAPGRRLRACINLGNAILAKAGSGGAPPTGVSVDLATELARQLGAAIELIVVDAAAKSVDAVRSGAADVGFFAVDPARSDGILFSAPYLLIEGAYLVRQGSPVTDNTQVDRAGTRVMVARRSAYDLYLSRTLKAATLMHTTTSQSVVPEFIAQGADVAAGVKQQLQADAARLPGLRLLPGRFMVIEQAMGVPAARGAEVQRALARFVEWAKAGGFVAQALQRHGIDGATVAPAVA